MMPTLSARVEPELSHTFDDKVGTMKTHMYQWMRFMQNRHRVKIQREIKEQAQ